MKTGFIRCGQPFFAVEKIVGEIGGFPQGKNSRLFFNSFQHSTFTFFHDLMKTHLIQGRHFSASMEIGSISFFSMR